MSKRLNYIKEKLYTVNQRQMRLDEERDRKKGFMLSLLKW
jgi:hypothetical protein